MGGYNESYHRGKIIWVPMNPNSYDVPLKSMRVAGSRGHSVSGLGHSMTMVDSGSTYTYMATRAYRALKSNIEAHCKSHDNCGGKQQGGCWTVPSGKLNKFPVVEMYFGKQKTYWKPRAYLYREGTSKQWCYSFQDDGPGANTVLGASWMLYHDVIFDLRSHKLGIVQALCPAYKERPSHSTDHLEAPTVAEWNAIPRPPPNSGGGNHSDDEFLDDPPIDLDLSADFSDDSEGLFSGPVRTIAGIAGVFVLCGFSVCGFQLLRRIDVQDPAKGGPGNLSGIKHKRLEQVESATAQPQMVGEPQSPTFAIDEVASIDEDEEAFQMVQNVDAGLNPLGSPTHMPQMVNSVVDGQHRMLLRDFLRVLAHWSDCSFSVTLADIIR